jgi:N-acetylglutamate synthase-like GNAT family acetyltransferase
MHGTLIDQLTVKQAEHYSLPLVKQFYKKNGMRAQAPKGEAIYIASKGTHIIAALRLSPSGNDYLLRSMCVSAELRQQGIGSHLLQHIQSRLNAVECYCFPYSHLESFYQSAGFTLIDIDSAPEAIRDKFTRYLNNGKDIVLMKHQQVVVE